MDLLLIFFSGLTLGGATCSLIQIGLFSSLFAQSSKSRANIYWMTAVYVLGRVGIGALIGLLLGFLGSLVLLSQGVLYMVQLIAGLVMILTALSFSRWGEKTSRWFQFFDIGKLSGAFQYFSAKQSIWTPLFFAVVSFFIPCGATLAVEAQALTTGSPFYSMLLISIFVLGTIPAFLGISLLGKFLSARFRSFFRLMLVTFLFLFGTLTINGVLVLIDAPVTIEKLYAYSPIYLNRGDDVPLSGVLDGEQRIVEIKITNDGYTPDQLVVRGGETVVLRLETENVYNCASIFKIPSLGISQNLPVSGVVDVSFIAPEAGQTLFFSCSTGLKTGTITVL